METLAALADKYKIGDRTLRQAIALGKFDAKKSGWCWLVDEESEAFQTYIQSVKRRVRGKAEKDMVK